MSPTKNILVLGGGTAGVLHAALLGRNPDFKVRLGYRSKSPVPEGRAMKVLSPDGKLLADTGSVSCVQISRVEPDSVDHLVLCTPLHEILRALEEVLRAGLLSQDASVASIAALLGLPEAMSALLVEYGKSRISYRAYSNFFAAARPAGDHSAILINKIKNRIFYWDSGDSNLLCSIERWMFTGLEQRVRVEHPMELACRNINTWVHPPLVFRVETLDSIFIPGAPRVALYDLGPGNAVNLESMLEMGQYMKEIEDLFETIGIRSWNTLAFLNDDNYPVSEDHLKQLEIDAFPDSSIQTKAGLLMKRYEGLRASSPGSIYPEPATWHPVTGLKIPRIPLEDVYQLMVLKSVATGRIETPVIDRFLARFESAIEKTGHARKTEAQLFSDSLTRITQAVHLH